MLRSLLAISLFWIATQAQAGVIGVIGGSSITVPNTEQIPEIKIDAETYRRIDERLDHQNPVAATFQGEYIELQRIYINNERKVIETNLRRKFSPY